MVEVTTTTYKLVGTGDTRELVVTPAVYKIEAGGNSSGATTAELVSIQDAGDYYTIKNVEGALQEVGASLVTVNELITDVANSVDALAGVITAIDDRLTTAEGEIDALQTQVADIIEPQSGEGIEVGIDGSVNLGGGQVVTGAKEIVIANTAQLTIRNEADTKRIYWDDAGGIEIVSGTNSFILNENEILGTKKIRSVNFTTTRQTLSISAGLIAWNIANGQSAVVTLTQSATLSNPTNLPASTETIYPDLEVIQNGTGGWVLSFDSNFVLPSTFVAAPTAANSRTLYHFHQRSDGKLAVNYTHYTS